MKLLDKEETLAVVAPYFEAVREVFVGSGIERASRVNLEVRPSVHDTKRHFAATRDDGLLVLVAPPIADLHEDELVGILAHELGHATDFLYPSRYQLAVGELREWERGEDDREAYNRTRQWKDRDKEIVERTADAIASKIFGRPIRYTGPCVLQSFERGTSPRPIFLR